MGLKVWHSEPFNSSLSATNCLIHLPYDAISVLPFSISAIKIHPEYSLDRIVAEGEAPILLPPDAKSWLVGKDPDAGKDWRLKEKQAAAVFLFFSHEIILPTLFVSVVW